MPKIVTGHSIALSILVLSGILTLTLHGGDISAILASATSSTINSSTTLYFTPYDDRSLTLGETTQIDINVNSRVPINAVGTTIKFSPDEIDIVGISKRKSFLDLWTEETAINEETGEVHFSAGTLTKGGLMGTGTAITLTVRGKKTGDVTLYFKDVQIFANDGKGTLVANDGHPLTFAVIPKESPSAPPRRKYLFAP